MAVNTQLINDPDFISKVRNLFDTTDKTLEQIAEELNASLQNVLAVVHKEYTKSERLVRKSMMYSRSKMGSKNPSFGRTGDEAFHFKGGVVGDSKGYLMVQKPSWYTGRKGSKYVFVHTVVMCEALGLAQLPAGFVVHHIDHNPHNNDIDNLALVTASGHSRIHRVERATTIPKGSRA